MKLAIFLCAFFFLSTTATFDLSSIDFSSFLCPHDEIGTTALDDRCICGASKVCEPGNYCWENLLGDVCTENPKCSIGTNNDRCVCGPKTNICEAGESCYGEFWTWNCYESCATGHNNDACVCGTTDNVCEAGGSCFENDSGWTCYPYNCGDLICPADKVCYSSGHGQFACGEAGIVSGDALLALMKNSWEDFCPVTADCVDNRTDATLHLKRRRM